MNAKQKLTRFILDDILLAGGATTIEPDQSLIAQGVLDSIALLRIVSFVHDELGVEIEDSEVTMENFDSIEKISTLVECKLSKS